MKPRTLRALAFAFLATSVATYAAATPAASEPPTLLLPDLCGGLPGLPNPNAGCQLPLERGVNLAVWLQYWIPSTYATSEDMQQIRELGFTFIRLPVNPELMLAGSPGTRTFDDAKATYIKRSIQLALDADLGVVIDLHPYESYSQKVFTNETYLEEYTEFLTAFARKIADLPADRVALGLLNEPSDPDYNPNTPFDYNPFQREFWLAARLGDLDLTLIGTGDDWSSTEGLQRIEPLPDPNVLYEFHFYTPFLFTHQGATWTWHVVKPIHSLPYPATTAGVEAVRASILDGISQPWIRAEVSQHLTWYGQERWNRARLADQIAGAAFWAEENDVRLFLGEFGVFEEKAPNADRVQWTRDVREIAESRNIAWAYWNWDSDFGVVDRDTGAVHEGLRSALLG